MNSSNRAGTLCEPRFQLHGPAILAAVVLLLFFLTCFPLKAEEAGPGFDLRTRIERDWMVQDHNANLPECFSSGERCDIEKNMVSKVLRERPDPKIQEALERLVAEKVPGNDPRWRKLYILACEQRRATRLGGLLKKTDRIVFTKHFNMGGSHYAYTEAVSDGVAERHFKPGSALCMMNVSKGDARVDVLLKDEGGVIRDPDVSYDGKRILFAWKKSDRGDDYHLYEMDIATRKIRQLTSGAGVADYEGCYLPNGDIVFSSTRCIQAVDCWFTEVSNLYICDKDGKYIRRLGFDQVHTNYPQVLDDGRVIYTRWDYNDRGQLFPQPLFQMNMDGTGQTEFYGNNSWFPTTIMHARGIPGTQKVVALISGHHCRQRGKLGIIDVTKGRQEAAGVQLIAPVRETRPDRVDSYGQGGDQFQYPYPINEREFIVGFAPLEGDPRGNREPKDRSRDFQSANWFEYDYPHFGIYYMDIDGNRELLAIDAEVSCNQPVLVMTRPVLRVRASQVDYRKPTGSYYVQNVYYGPGLEGVPPGTVRKLRVVAIEYRPAAMGGNDNQGPAGSAMVSTCVSTKNGTWDVKKVLGEADVYADGSAFFEVPARTPVYFQLLDATNQVVQTMRTWSTLMPGENASCIGCHEDKSSVPPSGYRPGTLAMKAGVQKLKPFYGAERGFSFVKEIQPILDKNCIRCHSDRDMAKAVISGRSVNRDKEQVVPADPGKSFSLLGATADTGGGRRWSDAYLVLTQNGKPNDIVRWLNVQSVPPMIPPYMAGSAKSRLLTMLREGHKQVKLSQEELDKIACWIDLLVPYCGDYAEANCWGSGDIERYARSCAKREKYDNLELDAVEAYVIKLTGKPFKMGRKNPVSTLEGGALAK